MFYIAQLVVIIIIILWLFVLHFVCILLQVSETRGPGLVNYTQETPLFVNFHVYESKYCGYSSLILYTMNV